MREVTEKTFADKIVAEMPTFKEKDIKYTQKSVFDGNSIYLIDKIFMKGVSAEREKNDTNFDYIVVQDYEKFGIKLYKHKYNTGLERYYFRKAFNESLLSKFSIEDEQKDPEAFYYRER